MAFVARVLDKTLHVSVNNVLLPCRANSDVNSLSVVVGIVVVVVVVVVAADVVIGLSVQTT